MDKVGLSRSIDAGARVEGRATALLHAKKGPGKTLIHVGCGMSVGRSWQNFDSSPTLRFERLPLIGRLYTKNRQRFPEAVRYGDIVRHPLCAPGRAAAVYCSHMLEHLALDEMRTALRHIHAMLEPDGIFRLIVPDLQTRIAIYSSSTDPDRAHGFMRAVGLGQPISPKGIAARIHALLTTSAHRWMYDEHSLRDELAAIGFGAIRRCHIGDSTLAEFGEIEDPNRYADRVYGPELALECHKRHSASGRPG